MPRWYRAGRLVRYERQFLETDTALSLEPFVFRFIPGEVLHRFQVSPRCVPNEHTTATTGLWSSQDLVEAHSKRLMSRFELLRTHAAEMAVAAR